MTQVNLPNRNITGDNLWSQVEDNDDAIADVVNGNIDNGNIKSAADINASKLLDGSITAAKLGTDSVTNAKIDAGAVNTAEIADGAITGAKIATSTTATATNDATVASGTITARKYADGLVVLEGTLVKGSGSWAAAATLATLPAGYRPATGVDAVVWGSTSSGATCVSIGTNGVISIRSGLVTAGVSVPAVTVGGITFHAA